jgi:TolB-like protein
LAQLRLNFDNEINKPPMSSIIEGYSYDIFISYRQKDNKHNGWVTEFVDNLKGELESAFKEDISVYFDSNPKDGLLETHDVHASVKDKLNCLIFIPVISRTYCDPKSFAWQFEFTAFIKKASEDQFGLKVRLPGGNVANRVLPIPIYDLDPSDKKLLEDLLGGYIRGIEFIYKSTGVNRPLLPREDNPQDNLNHTNYRDQINKVANAVKEIFDGLRNPDRDKTEISQVVDDKRRSSPKKIKTMIIPGIVILFALVLAGYFFVTNVVTLSKEKEKSIAVLPFHNYSDSIGQEWMSDGLTEEIINHLYKIKSFNRVVPLSSAMTYKGSNKKIPLIANELKVNYILEGTYKKIGDKVRINAQLVDPKKDRYIWRHEYDQPNNEMANIQVDIALQIADQINAFITGSEMKNLQNTLAVNPEAYNLYQQGRYFWNKRTKEGLLKSIDFYQRSIARDPGYALAYAGLADTYNILVFWDWWPAGDGFVKAKEYALKAIKINPDLAEAHAILGDILIWSDWKWHEAEKELKLAVELNSNCGIAHQYYSELLDIMRKNREAREQIDLALQLDPVSPVFYTTSALYYCNEGKFEESLNASLKTIEINPDFTKTYPLCVYSYLKLGEEKNAVKILKQSLLSDTLTAKYASVLDDIFEKAGINGIFSWLIESELIKPNPSFITIAWISAVMGKKDEALDWLEKALIAHSSDLPRINNYIIFSDLHSEPRFEAILDKIGL